MSRPGSNTEGDSNENQSRRDVLQMGGVALVGATALAGCVGGDDDDEEAADEETVSIAVGSKDYTEQINLGYVAYELIENNTDANPIDETSWGGNEAHSDGYQDGDIHAYYDYMGSLWADHPPYNESTPLAIRRAQRRDGRGASGTDSRQSRLAKHVDVVRYRGKPGRS